MDAEALLNNSRPQIRPPLKSGEIPSNSSAGVFLFFFFFRSSDSRRNVLDNNARKVHLFTLGVLFPGPLRNLLSSSTFAAFKLAQGEEKKLRTPQ